MSHAEGVTTLFAVAATRDMAGDLEDEERGELVKIFEKDKTEPTSLVDIPSSITHHAANHAFQFVRLYLVSPDKAVVHEARKKVASW